MNYQETRDFLAKHTELVELHVDGAHVAIAPQWQGRVMTSTCGGRQGPSFGFVNRKFIEAGTPDKQFNNYGGEERMWLSPEGGQFSLWFAPGVEQTWENWFTPPALNETQWTVEKDGDGACRMTADMKLQNASGSRLEVDVSRGVRLLGGEELGGLFGPTVAELMSTGGAQTVAFETANEITNRGDDLTADKGLLSVWILGMMNASEETVVIVPYKPGKQDELGSVVKADYFGQVPSERLKIVPEAVFFAADSHCRSKIGTSQLRAKNVLGSIDFGSGVLTLVSFTMPENPAAERYMNNMWGGPHDDPYSGDVVNSYNDGPDDSGNQLGPFYEVESLSPAGELKTGQSLLHRHRTIH
ncbi:MAG: DUF6786 family protein, partial [Thermoguttaceae bacterium]